MVQDDTPKLDPIILEHNLAALRHVDPQLARGLADLPDAAGPAPMVARARDGRLSFRLTRPDGSLAWFGLTSIPNVRAAALLEHFDAGKANVFFPGLAEGTEAKMLLQRLGPHRAVFVWEPELGNLKLALRLHNYADAISEKRLVLIACPLGGLSEALHDWLWKNPGHLCPNQMMMFPWQTMADIAPIRLAIEQAYQRTERDRQNALSEIHTRWRTSRQAQSPPAKDASTHVLILALHAIDEVWATADALSGAAAELGWPATVADIRSPGDIHSLARAARALDSPNGPPAFSILLDVVREQVADVLPRDVPAVCWLSHRAEALQRAGPDTVAVTDPEMAAKAATAGIDKSRIFVCPPPCLASIEPGSLDQERPLDVVMITDAGPIDPAALAPKLPSYAQIWKAAADLLSTRIETYTNDQAEAILNRTEVKAHARIDEPGTRDEILRSLSQYLAPSLVWRFIAERLKENGINFRIHGPAWATVFPNNAGPYLTTIRQKASVFRQAKVVIHADTMGSLAGDALLAAGCGAAVMARRHPSSVLPGGLDSLLSPNSEMLSFLPARELIPSLRHLLKDPVFRRNLTNKAMQRCLADHVPTVRLKALKTAATSVF